MRRRGLTLVELIVAVTAGVAIFGGALMIWSFSNRSRGVTATARALQTALLVQERLTTDLGRLAPVGPAPVQVPGKDPARMSFYAYDAEEGSPAAMKARGVVYALAKAPGPLTRECDGRVEAVGTAPLAALAFAPFESPTGLLVRFTLTVGREPGEPPGPPTVHSFLAPIPSARVSRELDVQVVSGFLDDADEPVAGDYPSP